MIQKKICLIGSFAAGKTSLVQQYVKSIFSEKYHTTLGVKIDSKVIEVDDLNLKLMIWDLAGEDEFMKVRLSYLRGSSGILFVADGTRSETLDVVVKLQKIIEGELGKIPFIVLINKSDLINEWKIDKKEILSLEEKGWSFYNTSAKTGENVDKAFIDLAIKILQAKS